MNTIALLYIQKWCGNQKNASQVYTASGWKQYNLDHGLKGPDREPGRSMVYGCRRYP